MSSESSYDLAFSFAGEDREYVESVKTECDRLGLVTYYDKERKMDQWGKSFLSEQRKVYSGYKTKHFVPFVSKYYFTKPIPTDEFKSALLESTKRSRYILPIKLDDSEISVEYLHGDIQYISKNDFTPRQLAQELKKIVDGTHEPAKDVEQLLEDELNLPMPKITPRSYNKYEEAEKLLFYVPEKFEQNLHKLKEEGYTAVVRERGDNVRIRVERDGKTLFGLNLFWSSMGDNRIGYNFDLHSTMANATSENGNIEPKFDNESQRAGYALTNYSHMEDESLLAKEDVVKFFWGEMNRQLESRA